MKELKNKVYELEGLLELCDSRPDKFSELAPLVEGRLAAVNAAWRTVREHNTVVTPAKEDTEISVAEIIDNPDISVTGVQPAEAPVQREPESRRIALCLNDRFRFTKILGHGDKKEFERRLGELSDAGDYERARDIITDSYALDPDDPDVADLIEIVKTYYE